MTDTGLSLPTIRKWWYAAEEEKPQLPTAKRLEDDKPKKIDNMSIADKWAMIDTLMEQYDWSDKVRTVTEKAKSWDNILTAAKKEPSDKALVFLKIASEQQPVLYLNHKKWFEKRFKMQYSFDNDIMLTTINHATSWKTIINFADKLPSTRAIRFLQLAVQYNDRLLKDYRWKDPGYNVNDHIHMLYITAMHPSKTPVEAPKKLAQ